METNRHTDASSLRLAGKVKDYFLLTKFSSVLVALILFNAAYIAEVVRSGLLSVPVGQTEAARALGMSPLQQALYVMLPIATYVMATEPLGERLN